MFLCLFLSFLPLQHKYCSFLMYHPHFLNFPIWAVYFFMLSSEVFFFSLSFICFIHFLRLLHLQFILPDCFVLFCPVSLPKFYLLFHCGWFMFLINCLLKCMVYFFFISLRFSHMGSIFFSVCPQMISQMPLSAFWPLKFSP